MQNKTSNIALNKKVNVLAGKCSVDVTTYKEDTGVKSGFVFLKHGNTYCHNID